MGDRPLFQLCKKNLEIDTPVKCNTLKVQEKGEEKEKSCNVNQINLSLFLARIQSVN